MNGNANHTTHRFRSLLSVVAVMLSVLLSGCSAANSTAITTQVQTVTETAAVETESTSEETQEILETSTEGTTEPETETEAEEESTDTPSGHDLSVTMLDVGQGLSILIGQDGHYMLYDGGPRKSSSYVVAYLKQHGITSLDYLISSHYDEDHIAGLVGVLHTTPVTMALTPDYTADSNIYNSFISALNTSSAEIIHPSAGDTWSFADSEFQVIGPKSYSYEGDNNNSICIRLTYGDFSCIMTGDAEEEAESDMIASGLPLSADLYVVGHHGSSSSSSERFVSAMQPSYAFISVGADNKYGHPTQKTLNTLQEHSVQIFRSDKQGEVTCTTDGTTITFSTDPTTDLTPGDRQIEAETKAEEQTEAAIAEDDGGSGGDAQEYVLNTHTMKFHHPDCSSVKKISEKNREDVTATRDELIQEGYSPCGNCKP